MRKPITTPSGATNEAQLALAMLLLRDVTNECTLHFRMFNLTGAVLDMVHGLGADISSASAPGRAPTPVRLECARREPPVARPSGQIANRAVFLAMLQNERAEEMLPDETTLSKRQPLMCKWFATLDDMDTNRARQFGARYLAFCDKTCGIVLQPTAEFLGDKLAAEFDASPVCGLFEALALQGRAAASAAGIAPSAVGAVGTQSQARRKSISFSEAVAAATQLARSERRMSTAVNVDEEAAEVRDEKEKRRSRAACVPTICLVSANANNTCPACNKTVARNDHVRQCITCPEVVCNACMGYKDPRIHRDKAVAHLCLACYNKVLSVRDLNAIETEDPARASGTSKRLPKYVQTTREWEKSHPCIQHVIRAPSLAEAPAVPAGYEPPQPRPPWKCTTCSVLITTGRDPTYCKGCRIETCSNCANMLADATPCANPTLCLECRHTAESIRIIQEFTGGAARRYAASIAAEEWDARAANAKTAHANAGGGGGPVALYFHVPFNPLALIRCMALEWMRPYVAAVAEQKAAANAWPSISPSTFGQYTAKAVTHFRAYIATLVHGHGPYTCVLPPGGLESACEIVPRATASASAALTSAALTSAALTSAALTSASASASAVQYGPFAAPAAGQANAVACVGGTCDIMRTLHTGDLVTVIQAVNGKQTAVHGIYVDPTGQDAEVLHDRPALVLSRRARQLCKLDPRTEPNVIVVGNLTQLAEAVQKNAPMTALVRGRLCMLQGTPTTLQRCESAQARAAMPLNVRRMLVSILARSSARDAIRKTYASRGVARPLALAHANEQILAQEQKWASRSPTMCGPCAKAGGAHATHPECATSTRLTTGKDHVLRHGTMVTYTLVTPTSSVTNVRGVFMEADAIPALAGHLARLGGKKFNVVHVAAIGTLPEPYNVVGQVHEGSLRLGWFAPDGRNVSDEMLAQIKSRTVGGAAKFVCDHELAYVAALHQTLHRGEPGAVAAVQVTRYMQEGSRLVPKAVSEVCVLTPRNGIMMAVSPFRHTHRSLTNKTVELKELANHKAGSEIVGDGRVLGVLLPHDKSDPRMRTLAENITNLSILCARDLAHLVGKNEGTIDIKTFVSAQ